MEQHQPELDSPSMSPPPATQPSPTHQRRRQEEMMACVVALEALLLPCLPARELQDVDRSVYPSRQINVDRHAREFMEAAKKLQAFFIGLQLKEQPSKEERLSKDITIMEDELKTKTELIKKHEKLIEGWRKELKDRLEKHEIELERV